MKEKRIMASFALANATDITLTRVGLELNHIEIGASADLINNGGFGSAAIAKTAVTIGIIGVYALAHSVDNERIRWSTEKSMIIANYLLWAVQVWNAINILAEVAS